MWIPFALNLKRGTILYEEVFKVIYSLLKQNIVCGLEVSKMLC